MKELDSKQKAFALYLADVLGAKTSNDLDSKIKSLSEDELDKLTTSFDTIYNQQMDNEKTIIAQMGAKLNYIKRLNKKCPDGYEVEKFEAGGIPCIRCKTIQTKATGEAAWMKKGSKVIGDIKSEMCSGGKMKCGGKTSTKKPMAKKTKKAEHGDKITVKKNIQIKEILHNPKDLKKKMQKGSSIKK